MFRSRWSRAAIRLLLLGLVACVHGRPVSAAPRRLLVNGGFESWHVVGPDERQRTAGWRLGPRSRVADGWLLNPAYPGELSRGEVEPFAGATHLTLQRSGPGPVHLYQMLSGLEPGRWYRFTIRVRGGELSAWAYQYGPAGPPQSVRIARGSASAGEWREVVGYYHVPEDDWRRSALALVLDRGDRVDLDEASFERVKVPLPEAGAADIVLENDAARLVLTATGRVGELRGRASGEDYLGERRRPFVSVVLHGTVLDACALSLEGDRLELRFPERDVRLALRVATGARHFRFEIVEASPEDMEEVVVSLPFRPLATVGRAFNATYDETFGLSLFGTTIETKTALERGPRGSLRPTVSAGRRHGIRGAAMALVAAPRAEFDAALMEAERASGLPSPMLGGEWARNSESVRRSYLFANPLTAAEIDTLIDYAKIGGFGAIVFLKDSWLANHGHFDINTEAFPGGVEAVREAVDRIHGAGLEVGAHVFGPSISPDDPYVTPVPDDRLLRVPCPPLGKSIDEHERTLTFAAPPPLPPRTLERPTFPGRHLRIGDEIIAYRDHDDGPPFRYVAVERGALGTRAAAHPAGAPIDGLVSVWRYFLVEPDSTLADELTSNFARVFNACGFDFVYFDASDGASEPYLDAEYYMAKLHFDFYRKIGRDVLYQTSLGTGKGLLWHLVPRAASADGSGDIKGYLDERWPTVLEMADDLTRADVGWYRWYREVRPDQIEYVSAKVAGIDGSLSLETSVEAMERLPQSRRMLETVGRWERCRAERAFSDDARAALREPGSDFKLFRDESGCKLYRAAYEEARLVDVADEKRKRWVVRNDGSQEVLLGFEIVRPPIEAGVREPESTGEGDGARRSLQLTVNGRAIDLGVRLEPGDAVVAEGVGPTMLWPPGMAAGRVLAVSGLPLRLPPGDSTFALSWETGSAEPMPLVVRLHRIWPLGVTP